MKNKRFIFAILLSLLLMTFSGTKTFATDTSLTTDEISQKEIDKLVKSWDITRFDTEPVKRSIGSFDVNENGLIIVGLSDDIIDFPMSKLCVYSTEGEFKYGYSFKCLSSFAVGIDEHDNIMILSVRGDYVVTIDPDGNITSVRRMQNTLENQNYRTNYIYAKNREIDGTKYKIRNKIDFFDFAAVTFTQLVIEDSSGEETVIYDSTTRTMIKTVLKIILIAAFLTLCGVIFYKKMKKKTEPSKKVLYNGIVFSIDNSESN